LTDFQVLMKLGLHELKGFKMNELVTKLWEQAAQRDDIWQSRHEKFAELIILECDRYAKSLSLIHISEPTRPCH
jgi:hypothetical protein